MTEAKGRGRQNAPTAQRTIAAGLVLGFGLGMFIDGILLHQLLQWHHMVSEFEAAGDLRGLETNTTWDGVFHLSAWVVTTVGAFLLWRSRTPGGPWNWRYFTGLLLIGWGAFHVVDQFVFHLLIGAHHIRQVDDYQLYDWSFFAVGVALILAGWFLIRGRAVAVST